MKIEFKTSKLAIICALCAFTAGSAMAAAPVRALGGTGTYNGASSAATSKTTGATATSTRAGALRVLPSTTKAVSGTTTAKPSTTTNSGSTTSTRAASTQRLSLGKYLAGNRVVQPSGGSSSGGGSQFVDSERFQDLVEDVHNLQMDMEGKQNELQGDGLYISIVDDTVSLDVDALKGYLGKNGDTVEISYDDETRTLTWTINDTETDSVSFADFATLADVQAAEQTLLSKFDNYYTKTEVDQAIAAAAFDPSTIDLTGYAKTSDLENYVTTDDLDVARAAIEKVMDDKLKAGDFASAEKLAEVSDELLDLKTNVYTKGEVYTQKEVNDLIASAVTDGTIDMSAYVTFTQLAELNWKTEALDNGDLMYKPLGALAFENEIDAETHIQENTITSEMIQSVSADKLDAGVTLEPNQIAMLTVDEDGNQVWQIYGIE